MLKTSFWFVFSTSLFNESFLNKYTKRSYLPTLESIRLGDKPQKPIKTFKVVKNDIR